VRTYLLVLAIAISGVLGVQMFLAEGAPANPTMSLQSGLTPGVAQQAQVVVSSQMFSVQPPNSIDQLGAKVVYSAFQNGIQVAFQQSQALGITGGSGSLYLLTATLPISLSALCSGSQCGGYIENLTVTAQVVVPTYDGVYTSAPITVTFLSAGSLPSGLQPTYGPTTQPPASMNQFNINLWGALTLAVALDLALAAAITKHPAFVLPWGLAVAVLAFETVLWGL
jgi:hypothetical protein